MGNIPFIILTISAYASISSRCIGGRALGLVLVVADMG